VAPRRVLARKEASAAVSAAEALHGGGGVRRGVCARRAWGVAADVAVNVTSSPAAITASETADEAGPFRSRRTVVGVQE